MNGFLDWTTFCLRFGADHLLSGLILSAAVFLGSVLVFLLLFREQRWSASTRYQASLLIFLALTATPFLTVLRLAPPADVPRPVAHFAQGIDLVPPAPDIVVGADLNYPSPKHDLPEPTFWFQSIDWMLVLAIAWAIFTAVCLFRVTLAIHRLFVLHRSSVPLKDAPIFRSRRKITIAQSPLISSPVAVGIWSPKVLLPPEFDFRFSAQDQANVLRHEIAHLDRFDDWWNLVQQLCLALFPINPFLWLLRWRLRLLEEIACDDWALAGSAQPRNYANLLTRLAANQTVEATLASGVSRRGNQLYQRVARILDKTCDRSLKVSVWKMVLVGCTTIGSALGGLFLLPVVPASAELPAVQIRDVKPELTPEVITLLKNSALNDADAGVREEAVSALSRSDGAEVTTALLSLLNESKDEQVRLLILHGLTRERVGEASVKEKLNDLASNEQSLSIRIAALSALARNIDDGVVDKFISIYRSATAAPVKQICLLGLGEASSKSAKDFLMSVAKDDADPAMRRVAVRALSDGGMRRVVGRNNISIWANHMFLRREVMPQEQELNGPDYFPFVPHDEMSLQPGPELTLNALPEELQQFGINRIELPKIIARKLLPGTLPPESPTTQPSAKPSETHEE